MLSPTDHDLYSGWLLGMSPIISSNGLEKGNQQKTGDFLRPPKKTGSPVDLPFQWEFQDPKMEVR